MGLGGYLMKTYKKVEWESLDKTFCDICKQEIKPNERFEYTNIELKARFGSIYPEDDFTKNCSVDFCRECFMDKLIPLLKQNYNVEFKFYDSEGDEVDWEDL